NRAQDSPRPNRSDFSPGRMRRHHLRRWPPHDRKQFHLFEVDSALRSLEQSPTGVRVKRSRVRLIERIRAVTRKRTSAQSLRAVQTRFRQSCPQRCREVREYGGRYPILQRLWSARIPQGQNGVDGVSALPAVEDERTRTAV